MIQSSSINPTLQLVQRLLEDAPKELGLVELTDGWQAMAYNGSTAELFPSPNTPPMRCWGVGGLLIVLEDRHDRPCGDYGLGFKPRRVAPGELNGAPAGMFNLAWREDLAATAWGFLATLKATPLQDPDLWRVVRYLNRKCEGAFAYALGGGHQTLIEDSDGSSVPSWQQEVRRFALAQLT